MKSAITFEKLDEDLLQVTMRFTFESLRGPALRKKMEALGYKIYPMDKARMSVGGVVFQSGQSNTSIHNEFTITRNYEILQDYDENEALAQAHAERYYRRVLEDLEGLA